MKERPKIDLGMTGYDELFMNDQERAENRLPKIYDIPLTEIDDFPNHPFQVRLDEDMDQLVESVKERGIITPITLRKKDDGRYEIVSGHRRRKACELAGLETIPAEIKDLTEAIPYDAEKDAARYTGTFEHQIMVSKGMFWAAFPQDGHKAISHSKEQQNFTKIILKLPVKG